MVFYLVLYRFKLINSKEKTSNTVTVSFKIDSCPFGYNATSFHKPVKLRGRCKTRYRITTGGLRGPGPSLGI